MTHQDQGSGPAPGWYADPWRQQPYRYWDGTKWTANVAGAPVVAATASPRRKSKTALVVAVLVSLLLVCGCSTFALVGLARTGLGWQAKTQRLVEAAPSDGSSVTATYSVGVSTQVGEIQQVTLNDLDDRLDHIAVRLEPGYDYLIDGHESSKDEFFQAAKGKTLESQCVITYSADGIRSLNFIP